MNVIQNDSILLFRDSVHRCSFSTPPFLVNELVAVTNTLDFVVAVCFCISIGPSSVIGRNACVQFRDFDILLLSLKS